MVAERRNLPVQQRCLNPLAVARLVSLSQGCNHSPVGHHPGEEVHQRETHPLRQAVGFAGQVHQPAVGLNDQVIARHIGHGAGAPVAGNGAVDYAGIDGADFVVTQAHAFKGPGAETLDHHVRIGGHLANQLDALRLLEVDGDAALVAVEGYELGALSVPEGSPVANLVAQGGLLDLHHVGAHIAQQHGTERPRQCPRQIYDLDVCQSASHVAILRCYSACGQSHNPPIIARKRALSGDPVGGR